MRGLIGLSVGLTLSLAATHQAQAQSNPLIGIWSATLYRGYGQPFASLFFRFMTNGRCVQRFIVVRGGVADYACRYRLSPDGSVLTYTFDDYRPKTHRPTFPLGVPITAQLQWQDAGTFIFMDSSGPIRYVRQR